MDWCAVSQCLTRGPLCVAQAGFALSRIEFTKVSGGRHIALQHVGTYSAAPRGQVWGLTLSTAAGADLMVRTVYHPDSWPLRMDVYDKEGVRRDMADGTEVYDVGGPCCFQVRSTAHASGPWLTVPRVRTALRATSSPTSGRWRR